MKLQEIRVYGLFDHFDHVIHINDAEKITIITAPNGYGKTTLLKIIGAIFNACYGFLISLDFSRIEIKLDNSILKIERKAKETTFVLEFSLAGNGDEHYVLDSSEIKQKSDHFYPWRIDQLFPWLHKVKVNIWYDSNTRNILDYDDVLRMYSDNLLPYKKILPAWLLEIIESVNIHLIQDQRLILRSGLHRTYSENEKILDTIKECADELANKIKNKSVESSEVSQKLDSSFLSRLLEDEKTFETLEVSELKNKLSELKSNREKLSNHSIIASTHDSPFVNLDKIKDKDTKVLTLYAHDAKEKLDVYSDILQRIDLFTEILNEKRLAFNKIKIDTEKGFEFVTDKGTPLQLTSLSSGEQHEVILLYELIFRTKNNALVLIDEPEISLHIAWQKEFLNDLKRIIHLQKFAALISTHSPQIIDANWDLVVELEAGTGAS